MQLGVWEWSIILILCGMPALLITLTLGFFLYKRARVSKS